MATDTGYAKRDFLRVCDICGHRFHFSQLKPIGELKFACPDDAPGLTALQISRFNARARPLIVKPNKHAKGLTQTPIYQLAEAQIFNFVAEVAPAGEREGSNDALAAAWAAIYMADVILQEKRPAAWENTARDVLDRCLTYLLTLVAVGTRSQGGGILYPVASATDTSVSWATGVALVKGYAITGNEQWLGTADLIAGYIRNAQCGDTSIFPTTFPDSSGPYHFGGLTQSITNDDDSIFSREYLIRDVGALWFLTLLQEVRGAGAVYPIYDVGGSSATLRASLATMIEELTAFAVDGAYVSSESEKVSGLDVERLRFLYLAAVPSGGSPSAAWDGADDGLPIANFALALAGLHFAGTAPDTIAAVMATLAASPSSTPVDVSEEQELSGVDGTYNPALCPASVLSENSPYRNESTLYDWGSLGLLAPILAAASPPTLRSSKDALSMPRRYTLKDITKKYIGPDGLSGLSLQPISLTNTSSVDRYDSTVVRAARAGLVYRQDPGHYPQLRGD